MEEAVHPFIEEQAWAVDELVDHAGGEVIGEGVGVVPGCMTREDAEEGVRVGAHG